MADGIKELVDEAQQKLIQQLTEQVNNLTNRLNSALVTVEKLTGEPAGDKDTRTYEEKRHDYLSNLIRKLKANKAVSIPNIKLLEEAESKFDKYKVKDRQVYH